MSVPLKNRDGLFDSECVNAFFHAFTHSESFMCLSDGSFETKLWEIIPRQKQVFDWKTCKNVADFFAKIVDYKSSFTSRHSIEVAEKAAFLLNISDMILLMCKKFIWLVHCMILGRWQ